MAARLAAVTATRQNEWEDGEAVAAPRRLRPRVLKQDDEAGYDMSTRSTPAVRAFGISNARGEFNAPRFCMFIGALEPLPIDSLTCEMLVDWQVSEGRAAVH